MTCRMALKKLWTRSKKKHSEQKRCGQTTIYPYEVTVLTHRMYKLGYIYCMHILLLPHRQGLCLKTFLENLIRTKILIVVL